VNWIMMMSQIFSHTRFCRMVWKRIRCHQLILQILYFHVKSVYFADYNVSVLLFTDSLCPAHDSVNQIVSVHEKGLQSNGVDVVTISSQNSEAFEKLARQYSVVCVPSVILIDSNGLVQGRMYGKEFSAEYIVQLFKTFYKP
jgi:hypothetical protein